MILTPAELQVLTGKKRSAAQARQLTAWGVPFRARSDKSLVVLRDALVASTPKPREPQLRLA